MGCLGLGVCLVKPILRGTSHVPEVPYRTPNLFSMRAARRRAARRPDPNPNPCGPARGPFLGCASCGPPGSGGVPGLLSSYLPWIPVRMARMSHPRTVE